MTEKEEAIELYSKILQDRKLRFPSYLFSGEQGKVYLAYMTQYPIEVHVGIQVEDIPAKVYATTLWNHILRPGANILGFDFIQVIDNAYPGRFQPWEFNQVPNGYWRGDKGRDRAIKVIKYVIEEKEMIPIHQIPQNITYHFFKRNRILGPFRVFDESPYHLINSIYPNMFYPWEFSSVPMNYWKEPLNVKLAMDWLLFKKIGFTSYEEASNKITVQHFFKYSMTGLLQRAFNYRLYIIKNWIKSQISVDSAGRAKAKT
ncbi:hypothetical protein [Anaerosolibacter sp.]|uniref:hypothetical protein n=1 Tax=Anaerosolibacter sp. TaxID=1872527 RepID=UPI0039F0083E